MSRIPTDPLSKALRFARSRRLFGAGERVLVASGGGVNSLAVLGLLRLRQAELHVGAVGLVAVDRGRPDDAEAVADAGRAAREVGVAFYAVEAEGRAVTTVALDVARREGYGRVALGHTLDDHALRVLVHIARGAPVDRLRPLAARTRRGVVRPLLGLSDSESAWIARAAGLSVVQLPPDADSPRPLADRLRKSVLPRLRVEAPRADTALVELARDVRSLRVALRALIREHWIRRAGAVGGLGDGGERVVMDLRAVRSRAASRIAAREGLRAAGCPPNEAIALAEPFAAVIRSGQVLRGDVVLGAGLRVGPEPGDSNGRSVWIRRTSRDGPRRKPPFG